MNWFGSMLGLDNLPPPPSDAFTKTFNAVDKDFDALDEVFVKDMTEESANKLKEKLVKMLTTALGDNEVSDATSMPYVLNKVLGEMSKIDVTKMATNWRAIQNVAVSTDCYMDGVEGDDPSLEEFCFHLKAHKWSAPIIKKAVDEASVKSLTDNKASMSIQFQSFRAILDMERATRNDKCMEKHGSAKLPSVWRETGGQLMKGSYCPMIKKWTWITVASCKCPGCYKGSMKDNQDWVSNWWTEYLTTNAK